MGYLVRSYHPTLRQILVCFAAVSALVAAEAGAQVQYYRAKMLPTLPGEGWTLGVSLNDATQVVGATQTGMAVGWSFASGLVPLSGDGAALGLAAGSGTAVGWSRGANGRPQAAMWSLPGAGSSFLSSLYAGVPAYESIAHAVNDVGWVLISARASIDDPTRLMLLRPGQNALDLGDSATGLYWGGGAASGIVAGSVSVPGNATRGMVWTEAQGFRSFSVNGGDTLVEGVNANGWVVGQTAVPDAQGNTQMQGFVHDAVANQTLWGWTSFMPRDINESGLVVGNLLDTGTRLGNSAAAWTSGAVVDLNTRTADLGLYELNQAVGVNAQGQILALGSLSAAGAVSPPAGAQGLATFLLSECLRCGQIKPNPNPGGTLLDVAPDWFDAFNEQDYRNVGTLQIGTLVVNYENGVLRNAGALDIYGGSGLLINRGQFLNEASGHLSVSGHLQRSAGSLTTNAGFVTLAGVGGITDDTGAIWLDQPGSTFVQNAGTVTLAGQWRADRSTWEQHAGEFTTLPGSFLEMASATASVGGTLSVRGRLELLPNLAVSPNQASTLTVTGTVVVGAGGNLLSARSSIDVNGGQLVNAGGMLDLANNSETRIRGGGALRLEAGTTQVRNNAFLLVEGAGSSLTVLPDAGLRTSAWLRVSDGAQLNNAGTFTNHRDGTVFIEDSVLRTDGLLINERGGLIQVRGSAAMLDIAPSTGPGTLFVNSGQIDMGADTLLRVAGRADNDGSIQLDASARLRVEGGVLRVARGGTIRGGEFVQESGATFVDGLIDQRFVWFWGGIVGGTGTIRGQTVFGIGVTPDETLTVRAGASPGTLTIDGDLTINSAVMEFEVGDFRRYDRLVVTGNLQLGQLAAVMKPEAGYAPDLNDRFDWLSAGSVSGDLSSVTLDASALGGGWTAQFGAVGAGSRISLDNAAATSWGPDVIGAGTSFVVSAGEITQIESFRHVVNRGDVEARGFVAVRNDASLTIDGGTFTVAAGGRLTSRGYINHNGSVFINAGLLRNYEDGSVAMYGPFNNRGVVENAGSWEQAGRFENEAGGRVANHGTIINRAGQGIVNSGRFENHGVIENAGVITNTQTGEFIVAAGAEVRSSGSGLDSYRDFGGITRVDGRLAASEIWFQGATVLGSGALVGPVQGDGRFELRPADTLGIEGSLTGDHSFDVWIAGADAFGYLTIAGDVTLQGGVLRFLLADGGYMPKAGDSFKWLRTSGGSVTGLDTLIWRIDVRVPGENGFDYPWTVPSGLVASFSGDTLAIAAVPEPRDWVLMAVGLFMIAWWRRRLTGRA